MVQENRTAHSKVNGTRTSGAGMYYDGGGVGQIQNSCPEMTNDLASKHTQ